MEKTGRSILVIGHRNPDTDSICSAIAYAALKNKIAEGRYAACRAGEMNQETSYVLKRFGFDAPRLVWDVSPKVEDVSYRYVGGITADTSLRSAWTNMRNQEVDTLPVVAPDGKLQGLVAVRDIMTANMDVFDTEVLAKCHTPYRNILETLNGKMVVGDPEASVERGRVFIGAANPESMEETVSAGDILILSNRYESQICAIEIGVSLMIVCLGATVSKTVQRMAEQRGVAIMSVPYDTYAAAKLVCQSAPVSYFMTSENVVQFGLYTLVDEAVKVMANLRHRYFPILDENGKYRGMMSRRNVINMPKRQMILVDHNESTQSVEGTNKAEILEIIDHHRIGRPETSNPIYFRNQPVGCTATIVAQMYAEEGEEITPPIAGILLGAILSDTLAFRSPTSTPVDERTAKRLAQIAQVDMEQFAAEMFEAGEQLGGKKPEEVLQQDFKIFMCEETRFGIAQVNFMSSKNLNAARQLIQPALNEFMAKQKIEDMYVLLTHIPKTSSLVLCAGVHAGQILSEAYGGVEVVDGSANLPDVISRKKQFLPAVMKIYQQQ